MKVEIKNSLVKILQYVVENHQCLDEALIPHIDEIFRLMETLATNIKYSGSLSIQESELLENLVKGLIRHNAEEVPPYFYQHDFDLIQGYVTRLVRKSA